VVAASNVAVAAFVSSGGATPAPAPNWAVFIADGPQSIQIAISMHMKRGQTPRIKPSARGILARLIEFEHAPGCLDVKVAKLVFHVIQVSCGDAVILCGKKKQ
jgi:hypothetical protein